MSAQTRAARMLRRIRAAAGEMSYAQNRVLELQTGQTFTRQTRAREQIDALYVLFRAEAVSSGSYDERELLDAPNEDRRDDWSRLPGS